MMRSPKILVLPLMMFAAACGDSEGGAGGGDAAGVFPSSAYLGRTVEVEITGDTTSWDASASVDFGQGVTVKKVDVVSPQALRATIAIDSATVAGKHDVTVTEGSEAFTLSAAFELKQPFGAEAAANFEQGGFGAIRLTNADLLHPIDLTTDDDGNFINIAVANDNDGVFLSVSDATADTVTLSAQIDVNATTTGTITLMSVDTDGTTQIASVIDPVDVTPRTATVITPGTPVDFTMVGNGALFEITATEAGLLSTAMTTDPDAFVPGFILLPASGKFADGIEQHLNFSAPDGSAVDNRIVAPGDKFYLVAAEFFIGGGYPATFTATSIPLTGVTAVADTGDNGVVSKAQTITGPLAELDGTLTDATDIDCVKIQVANNKKLHVFTTDNDGTTDTAISIYETGAADDADADFVSFDGDTGEDFLTDALTPAGIRTVCISWTSANVDKGANAPYKAFIRVE